MPKKDEGLSGVKEIARRANVSIGTVDRVLHSRNGVAPKTRERVLAVIREMDYKPNLLARRLASKKVIRLVVLMPSVSGDTSFWSIPLQGVRKAEEEVRQYNITIEKYFFDQDDPDTFLEQSREILRKKPDGILMAPDFVRESAEFCNKCSRLGIPFVFIDSDIEGQNSLSYIGPHLFNSGYFSANFVSYILRENESVLLLNISRRIYKYHHLLRKEEGFRSYFKENAINTRIEKIDIKKTDIATIEKKISAVLSRHKDIRLVFVTNSRVSVVAQCLKRLKKKLILIGYDFVRENVRALEAGDIDFLVCQKPGEQAYRGIMALYKHIVLNEQIEKVQFMPIDLITKSNYQFYEN